MATVNSHEDVLALGQGRVVFEGTYSFHTPGSINAPQGTFTLTISEVEGLKASGKMEITTLWGTTTHTSLTYNGKAEFNGSTGYTIVNGVGSGTMTYDFTKKRHVVAEVSISLQPGMREGEVTIQGFGENMPCMLTKMGIDDLPR